LGADATFEMPEGVVSPDFTLREDRPLSSAAYARTLRSLQANPVPILRHAVVATMCTWMVERLNDRTQDDQVASKAIIAVWTKYLRYWRKDRVQWEPHMAEDERKRDEASSDEEPEGGASDEEPPEDPDVDDIPD